MTLQQTTPLFKKDDLNLLKESVDIFYLMDQLGIKYTKASRKELRGTCSIHGGDNKTAFRFNLQKRTWVCFTHKCHEEYGNDILGLIMAKMKCDFKQALSFLKNIAGDIDGVKTSYLKRKQNDERNNFISTYGDPVVPSYVSEEALLLFKSLRFPFFTLPINGGFSVDTLNYFEVSGGFVDSFGIQRDIIPIRNAAGTLVAYSLRDITGNSIAEDSKYILTEGFVKDSVLYNLNNARRYCVDLPLIIVEGFKSVWKLYEYGIYNVVAVMGSCVTEGQVDLLKAYALKGIVILFDPDSAGLEGAEYSMKLLNGLVKYDIVLMSETYGSDPAELSKEKTYSYLGSYVR